jgi:glycine cleavage system aminomethyltransferase T
MPQPTDRRTLQDVIDEHPDLVDYFYNDTIYPLFRARTSLIAQSIPREVSNWRDEQRAWRETAVLFDQSHHMPVLFLRGPDALKLLERTGINSFANFTPDRAKQFVACTPRGHVVGDCVAYNNGHDGYELISGMTVLNWVEYQAQAGEFDVSIERDMITAFNPAGRRVKWRYQLDGPHAEAIFDAAVEGETPDVPFFRTATVTIGGHQVLVLRHGMAGHKGYELSGPFEEGEAVRAAIVEAGAPHGLVRGGTLAYFSTPLESGWIPYPPAGIFTGEETRGFREWLPADGWEAQTQIGGSFYSSDIEDYYVTPWDLGYGNLIGFDHDFIGREALEKIADQPHRQKVTLVWNAEDTARIYASQFGDGPRFKQLDLPMSVLGWPHADRVSDANGDLIGRSVYPGVSSNDRTALSLAFVDAAYAEPGSEVEITWGEINGGSRKPHVEPHEQTQVRATVAPAPFASMAREMRGTAVR